MFDAIERARELRAKGLDFDILTKVLFAECVLEFSDTIDAHKAVVKAMRTFWGFNRAEVNILLESVK